jgi:hypothetical protein
VLTPLNPSARGKKTAPRAANPINPFENPLEIPPHVIPKAAAFAERA